MPSASIEQELKRWPGRYRLGEGCRVGRRFQLSFAIDCSSLVSAACTSETCFFAFAAMLFISRRLPLATHCLIGTAYSGTIGPFLLDPAAFLPDFFAALAIQ